MDKAIEFFTEALKDHQDVEDFYTVLAAAYFDSGKYDEAVRVYKDGLAKFKDSEKLHFNLAIVYDRQKDYTDSIAEFNAVLKIDPKNADACNYIGYTHADSGENLDEALELVKKALSIDSKNGFYEDSLGWVYFKKGEYDRALEELLKAAALLEKQNGGDATVYEHIGDAYAKSGKPDKAVEYYNKSLKSGPDSKKAVQDKINGILKAK
jgi:tetratricopeptide (TPR) repeat protein